MVQVQTESPGQGVQRRQRRRQAHWQLKDLTAAIVRVGLGQVDRAGRARAGAAAAAVVGVAWRGAGMPQSAQQCKVGASSGLALAMSGPISCMLQVMALNGAAAISVVHPLNPDCTLAHSPPPLLR